MTIFNSQAVNNDPLPVMNYTTGKRDTDDAYMSLVGDVIRLEPRAEFVVNDPNPILLAFRDYMGDGYTLRQLREHAHDWGLFTQGFQLSMSRREATRIYQEVVRDKARPSHERHASKVFARLANLTPATEGA
ncbi:hypothetical protein G7068_15980 [Leucobacter viscericola]|uniref:Uncharacterized protein n=1 Tax=Leucobacter viscericola TaxID=2714935 RepID=A0A6G7XAZ0_9MICO|nr:hypothetical protein [Leucobacter viscericola]QIK61770.1 hypothetical protein G7068_00015 [Leucobacter viscericola]QIK64545.1 hypothetical protein G7068_15980 [Leucobacter viscericola]